MSNLFLTSVVLFQVSCVDSLAFKLGNDLVVFNNILGVSVGVRHETFCDLGAIEEPSHAEEYFSLFAVFGGDSSQAACYCCND